VVPNLVQCRPVARVGRKSARQHWCQAIVDAGEIELTPPDAVEHY
jgi:hypothetical protein